MCFLAIILGGLAGCQKPDDIVQYTVARPPHRAAPADTAGSELDETIPGQLLGAILPQGKMTWFFKLIGPEEDVKAQTEPFLEFVRSLRFERKKPEWSLPEGWTEAPGAEMRFATLRIATEREPLEVSVIPLPTADGVLDEYILSNVNRWRDQLQLAPISRDELSERVVKYEVADAPVWMVNYTGRIPDPRRGKK
jgi:hypothetical protein